MSEDRFGTLNDYLDGTLPPEERAALERRLEEDPALAAELGELRALLAAAAGLPREIPPRRDLWPGIERRVGGRVVPLRSPRARAVRRAAAMAAAAALVIFALARNGDDGATTAPEPPRGTALGEPDRAALDLEHAAASREVLERLARGEELDPETVDLIRRNLAIIDEAVREIREALDESPEDPRLHHRLDAEVRRRGEVLRQAADLGRSI